MAAVVFVSGCNGPLSPPMKSSEVSPPTPARPADPSRPVPEPVVTNPSSASVVIEDPFAIVSRDGSRFGYAVRFLLREVKGASGATIQRIVIYSPLGSDEASAVCWRDTLRLPPGGTLDTFSTDDGARWLGYCGPGSGGDTAPDPETQHTGENPRSPASDQQRRQAPERDRTAPI
jgi:hypothetical protein